MTDVLNGKSVIKTNFSKYRFGSIIATSMV